MSDHETPQLTKQHYRKRPTSTAKGAFLENIWHCDCNPRLPAERFQVKKESKNKGRWFYTCQMSDKEPSATRGCGMFLWAEDAELRQKTAVMTNPRTEAKSTRQEGSFEEDSAPSEDNNNFETIPGTKRTSSMANLDEHASTLATPRKAPKLSAAYMTPETLDAQRTAIMPDMTPIAPFKLNGRTRVDQLLTPRTPRTLQDIPIAPQSAASIAMPAAAADVTTPTNQRTNPIETTTPRPSRHFDATVNADTSHSRLVKEVMAAMADVPAETKRKVADILSTHEIRAEGVRKGRDLIRVLLSKREQEIAHLKNEILRMEKEIDHVKTTSYLDWKEARAEERARIGHTLRS